MQSKVAPYAATPDPTFGQSRAPQAPAQGGGGTGPERGEEADLRLIIEEDAASGSYVYKTIDRRTGEVVQQLPREEVLRLREQADYHAGEVIRTKA